MADRWQFERIGMGYRCWADKVQTEFRLSHIKRSRGDLTGELAISTHLASAKTHNNGVLHVARFNVLSSAARASLAKTLEKRVPGQENMDWFDGLESLCQNVIAAEAKGEDINEVGLAAPTPPHLQWLVEPLILKGRPALLYGPGGVGKSLVALTCGLSVAVGREIIPGIAPAAKGPVLYLDWETTADVINDRIQAIARGHDFQPGGMYYRRCVRPLADDAEELSMFVAEKGIVLVIVDSAAYAMGTQGEYGDANESVLRLHEGLRMIGATSQIVDHVNKTEARAKGGTATPYGSAYKTWAARISWEVRKAPTATGLAINLYQAKSNDTAQHEPLGLSLEWSDFSILYRKAEVKEDEESDDLGMTAAIRVAVLELTAEAGMEVSKIASALESSRWKHDTIRKTVYRMAKAGDLTRDARGTFRAAHPSNVVNFRRPPGSSPGADA